MLSAMQEARRRGAEEMFLEVDETNLAAVSMYRRLDFVQVGERRAYYAQARVRRARRRLSCAAIFASPQGIVG
jgi:ribosomal protein S18 acetylase RimI-like enzyme